MTPEQYANAEDSKTSDWTKTTSKEESVSGDLFVAMRMSVSMY